MAYSKEERERILRNAYEFYNITNDTLKEKVESFIEEHPWSAEHANLVFVYIRTLTDYKVLCELNTSNDIRLRNSLVSSIDRLHKQVFSYKDADSNKKDDDNDMDELFQKRMAR